MANPYRDENGKYCSAQDMFNAVLRLQQEGKAQEAAALFLEYKAASKPDEDASRPTETLTSFQVPGKPTFPPVGTYTYPNQEPGEKQAEVLARFFHDYDLKSGTTAEADEAELAFEGTWEEEGGNQTLADYDPNNTDDAQILFYYSDNGGGKVLYAYKGGVYRVTEPLFDSWGGDTKYGNDTEPADLNPVIVASSNITVWNMKETRVDFLAREERDRLVQDWADHHASMDEWGEDITVEGATQVDAGGSEVSHGYYENWTVYRDDITGHHYQVTTKWSSWDGADEDGVFWEQVEPQERTLDSRVTFKAAKAGSN